MKRLPNFYYKPQPAKQPLGNKPSMLNGTFRLETGDKRREQEPPKPSGKKIDYPKITVEGQPKLMGYTNHADGCSKYRVLQPFGNMDKCASEKGFDPHDERWKNCPVIIQRISQPQWIEFPVKAPDGKEQMRPGVVKLIQKAGQQVFHEQDDSFLKITNYNPLIQLWTHDMFKQNVKAFTVCDGAIVSVEELKDQYKHLNSNIHVIPNTVDFNLFPNAEEIAQIKEDKRQAIGDKIIIGWSGSYSHHFEMQEHHNFFRDLIGEFGDRIHLVFGFYNPQWNDIPYETWDWQVDYQDYYRKLAEFDIGLALITDNAFNRAKSDIKFLEYAANRTPCVASKVLPYETIKHGETGFLAKNQARLYKYVRQLIEDADVRQQIGDKSYDYVYTQRNAKDIHALYEKALNLPPGYLKKE